MGLVYDPDADNLWMSSICQVWRFENALACGQNHRGHDRLYVPQVAYTTGDLDIHDIALTDAKRPVFVNTLYSCLATISSSHSFKPLWRPPFISRLAAEERCHLNGLAMQDGQPAFVTSISQSDTAFGWRSSRLADGCIISVPDNEVLIKGLCLPHSPRFHQDKLWLLNSGSGEFGYVNLDTCDFHPVAICPGFPRGLVFVGDYAVIGVSKERDNGAGLSGLPISERFEAYGMQPRCGLVVIDLRSGDIVQFLDIEGVISELYDVVIIPNAKRPMALGLKTEEIHRTITIEGDRGSL